MRKGNVLLKVNDVHFESDNIWKPVTGVLENESVWFGWSKDCSYIDSTLLMFREIGSDTVHRMFLNVFFETAIGRYNEEMALKLSFRRFLEHGHLENFSYDQEEGKDDFYNKIVSFSSTLGEMESNATKLLEEFASHRVERANKTFMSRSQQLMKTKKLIDQKFKRFL